MSIKINNIELSERALRVIVFFTLLLLTSTVIYPQSESYTRKYNLDFQLNDLGWIFDFTESGMSLKKDSLMFWNGKIPLVMTRVKHMDMFFLLKGAIQQRILLPEVKADSAEIQITCKRQHLKKAYLVIGGINSQEIPLFRDTIHIAEDGDWSTFKGCVPLKNVAMIHLKIGAEGKYDNLPQNLWLDKIEILIDGKKIDDYPLPTAGELAGLPVRPTPLSFVDETCYGRIPELGRKKVLAIGESFHGSGTISKISQQLMKYQIVNNNCKLILFERPIEEMLSVNRFVQGDEAFKIDSLAQIAKDNIYLPYGDDFLDFFSWLKEYNRRTDNKVSVLGIDIALDKYKSNNYFFNYLFTINQGKRHPLIDSLCVQLLESDSLSPIIQKLNDNEEFEAVVGKKESELFKYCLQLSDRLTTFRSPIPLRDSLMNCTTQYLIDHLCSHNEKVTIYSHLFHSCYLYNPLNMKPIFGSFMKEKYGDNYSCIGVIAGAGEFLSVRLPMPVAERLQAPIKNSLENLFYQTGLPYCYLPLQAELNNPIYMRYIGSGYTKKQYQTIVPSVRMDGVIFVRDSKAVALPKNTIDKNYRGNAIRIRVDNRKRMGITKDRNRK